MRPVLYQYWLKIQSGKEIPQFDPETGKERGWLEDPGIPEKVYLLPFSPYMAQKVQETEQTPVVADDGTSEIGIPEWEIDPNGHEIKVFRRGYYTCFDYYVCPCGTAFQWFGQGPLQCPNCGTKNEWYCDVCDRTVDDPIFLKNGEVRCPVCEVNGAPRGLLKIERLMLVEDHDLRANQVIHVPGKFEIEVGPEYVRVKVL
ncbi:MAG: hypothetical protein N3G75_06325 [Methanothrix sp.]|nr:hypothetical protein [Methanothrix sp.]MCX8207431.1 hypothetical protein [Methanothrix sp.]